ncbi:MAG: hypothetical protein LQ349_004235 [Xanthoria aureola]|nr:MAG: hypothetical protein LQ349_004235 [Xanthoria aureola]
MAEMPRGPTKAKRLQCVFTCKAETPLTILQDSALLNAKQVLTMTAPIEQDIRFLRTWLSRPGSGDNFLRGREASLWDMNSTDDLVALSKRPGEYDVFTRWIANSILYIFHRYIGHWLAAQRPNDEEAGFSEYDDSRLMAMLQVLTTLLSSTLPVVSTVALYLVKGMPLRLAMIALFVTLFCGVLAIFTNARRVEIFAAAAAVSKNFGVSWGSNVLFQPGTTFVMTSVGNTPIVGATLSFLRNDDGRYAHEKPYALRYNPQDGIPTENIVKKTVTDIPLHDIRKLPKPPCFDGNGIEVRLLQTQLSYSDFFSDEKIKTTFFSELREDLARLLGTSNIQIFEYKVRRRSPTFPVSDGNNLEWAQPVSVAHIDFNLEESKKMVYYHNGSDADDLVKQRFQCVKLNGESYVDAEGSPRSIWKPLRGPVRDWPLALCDARTIDPARDLVTGDVVYQDHAEENYQVCYNPRQRWLYLSDQMPHEMLVFRTADSWEDRVGPGELVSVSIFCLGVTELSLQNR